MRQGQTIDDIEFFVSKLKIKRSGIDFSYFKDRLSTLNIFFSNYSTYFIENLEIPLEYSLGFFQPDTNNINLYLRYDKASLYHELFHLLSSPIYCEENKKIIKSGFAIKDYERRIFTFENFNEGYTEYLTRKYFTRNVEVCSSYGIFVFLAGEVNNLVGSKQMEEWYSTADLESLINELSNFIPLDEVKKLLSSFDKLIDSDGHFDHVVFDEILKLIEKAKSVKENIEIKDSTYYEDKKKAFYSLAKNKYSLFKFSAAYTLQIQNLKFYKAFHLEKIIPAKRKKYF
ncbi:MAG: hypothetical protein R3Y21_01120 [Mycoplasmatota bacterium]